MTAVTAAGAAFALIAGGGVLMAGTDDRSAPPAHEPAHEPMPERMSPQEVVNGEASRLNGAAVSLDDLDVRIALWEADCPGCRKPDGGGVTRSALALTTDGFASTTYVPGAALGVQAPLFGPRIESLTEDLFLIVDVYTPREWLVRTDGTVQRLDRARTRLAPDDPRLWFRCRPVHPPAEWEEAPYIDPAKMYPWCSLDPDSATAYEWPARWNGSLALPGAAEEPWGIDDLWQPTFAWWEVGGQRHRRFLAESPPDARGAVWNPPNGGPLFFTRSGHESGIDLIEPREGTRVRVIEREAAEISTGTRLDLMAGTPDGALLAVSTYPEMLIWRAEDLADDAFELVHEGATTSDLELTQEDLLHEPTSVGDRIHVWTPRGVVTSDDDGRTWTEITTWR